MIDKLEVFLSSVDFYIRELRCRVKMILHNI
jgi:hypothetical protein